MKFVAPLLATGLALGLSACASSDATTVRLSNVWNTTCGTGSGGVVISAPTLEQFHRAVEQAPECQRGYTANPPVR